MEIADVLCLSLYVLLLFGLCIKTPLSSSLLAYFLLSSRNKHTHYDFSLCVFCMDFGKQGSWDSSSDEYEPQQQHHPKDDTDNDPTKRPYECTFCKRGFTNAQALGGHMNIHRKDRARPKHRNFIHSSSSSHSNDQFFPPLSTQPNAPYYPPPPSYRMYFDTAAANFPIHPQIRSPAVVNQELLGANLSLQIDQTRGVWENEEVDLELRLGHEYR